MARSRKPARLEGESASNLHTLAIDVGGTGLKASVLDETGRMMADRVRVETPVGATPGVIVNTLVKLVQQLPSFDRVSVGFPGVVRDGHVRTAPNLRNKGWRGYDLAGALQKRLGKPVRIINDADMQGLGVIRGKGIEMVVTLGTGFGTGLYWNGRVAPHLEIAHHPFRKDEDYDQQLGEAARQKIGNKKWKRRVQEAIVTLRNLVNFDRLYVGGGNAKKIDFKLDPDVVIVDNKAGIEGGIALWQQSERRESRK
jgi:polyphosphate glucokinase